MTPLETLTLEHLPPSYAIHLALFRDVRNAAFLHQQLLSRNTAFEYAFIDASVVVSRLHLLAAVFRAVTACANAQLKTPNVHSEIVAALSPSNNIADAYRRFGISPSTSSLLVIKVSVSAASDALPSPSASEVWDHLNTHVEGTSVPPTDENIASVTEMAKVRKYYKLNGLKGVTAKEEEAVILGGMALRGL